MENITVGESHAQPENLFSEKVIGETRIKLGNTDLKLLKFRRALVRGTEISEG